jgi:tetratricopeptide (TPR) repeat protein
MKLKTILVGGLLLCSFGCANPLNKATYYRYLEQGAQAEGQSNIPVAEVAYSRALGNVYMGNLGPEREAEALFNLGRLERLNGKLDLSLEHLLKSLEIDEEINGASVGLRRSTLGEIAKTYYEKNDLETGLIYLERMYQLGDPGQRTGQSIRFTTGLTSDYVAAFRAKGEIDSANKIEQFSGAE